MKELKGKNCFITGAASGIGRSLSIGLAKEGMNLFITDIDMVNLEKVKTEIENLGLGINVFTDKCDVAKYEDFEKVGKEVAAKLGDIDLLVNDAGIAVSAQVEELELEDWKKVLDVNLWSVIYSIKVFLPRMLERETGHIVNVASAAGILGFSEPLPYVTSKFAVVGLSEGLYGALCTRGLEVSVILPSYIKTNIFHNALIKFPKNVREKVSAAKLEEVRKIIGDEMASKGTDPDRAAKKYIRGIKNNELYIVDSKAILNSLIQKADSQKYKCFIDNAMVNLEDTTKKYFLKAGINIDDIL
jgi:short-subunit dehydrogenase